MRKTRNAILCDWNAFYSVFTLRRQQIKAALNIKTSDIFQQPVFHEISVYISNYFKICDRERKEIFNIGHRSTVWSKDDYYC